MDSPTGGDQSHWFWTKKLCRYCDRPTHLRDSKRSPVRKACAETLIRQQAADAYQQRTTLMATIACINGRLNTTLLGEAVAIELSVSNEEGARAVRAVFDVITRAAVSGHTISVTNFGTWVPVDRPARTARNPITGEPVSVPARQELTFRMSDRLRELVAAGNPVAATIRKHPKTTKTAA
ncbi:HU family DNA-binding protein [Streptomyces sp. NBC_01411]|uniref:HU family DNA-binding protein n=1 Tax=Streptomyces sp. NBC_01411 TaxID=2903857 RepID=UPI003250E4F4